MISFFYGTTKEGKESKEGLEVEDTPVVTQVTEPIDYTTKVDDAFFVNGFEYEDIQDAEVDGLEVRNSDPDSGTCKVMYLDTGVYYAGDFVDGYYHGLGKIVEPSGIIKAGLFKDGELLKGNILLPDGHYEYFTHEDEQYRVCFQDGCSLVGYINTSASRPGNKSVVDGVFNFPYDAKTPEEKYKLMDSWQTPQMLYFIMATFPGCDVGFFNTFLKNKIKISWFKKHFANYEYMIDIGLLGNTNRVILRDELVENFGFKV